MKVVSVNLIMAAGLASLVLAAPASAQTTGGLSGQIIDAQTQNPVADAVVIATSPQLQGEQTAVTDASGTFEITLLPSGVYTINVQREGYNAFTTSGVKISLDRTIKIKLQLIPEAVKGTEVVIEAAKPVIATTSETTGSTISKEQMSMVPYGRTSRSFDAVVQSVPGVHTDTYGTTIGGSGSSESSYIIDGVQVNDPAYGTQGTTLLQDFVQEVDVKTGGYQAEYGRSSAGIVNVVTKSGSNEFHGTVFANYSPFEATRNQIGSVLSIASQRKQNYNLDFGAELGGPIMKDKLWFYVGFAPEFLSTNRDRIIQHQIDDGTGRATLNPDGTPKVAEIARKTYVQTQTSYQFTGKLTFLANENHSIALALYGNPTKYNGFAGNGNEGVYLTDESLGAIDVALRYSGKLFQKTMLVEASLGYHQQSGSAYTPTTTVNPVDGVDATTLHNSPLIRWRGTWNLLDPHFDDGTVPDYQKSAAVTGATGCAFQSDGFNPCPVQDYFTGGTGYLQSSTLKRIAPTLKLSNFVEAMGHHQFKYGGEAAFDTYESDKYYTGGQYFYADESGRVGSPGYAAAYGVPLIFYGVRGFGHGTVANPLTPQFAAGSNPSDFAFDRGELVKTTKNQSLAAFAQDTWSIADKVVLDAGIRFEHQQVSPDNNVVNAVGQPAIGSTINLSNIMPRIGVIYDWTGRGLSKVYASFGRFYEYVPLDLADRSLSNEQSADYATNGAVCTKPLNAKAGASAADPRGCQFIDGSYSFNGGSERVDTNLQGQYNDQYQAGVQYQVYRDISIGADYTHKNLGRIIEDMSTDDGATYFLSNPGVAGTLGYAGVTSSGTTVIFPPPRTVYDALTIHVDKAFSDNYLFTASYTHSALRGNYTGLYDPEYGGGQLDPNITAEYDLVSLLPNTDGPLPNDVPNSIKMDGGYLYEIDAKTALQMGARLTADQGTPTNYLGSHPLYGTGAAYILPRGSGARLPWVWQLDLRAQLNYKMTKDYALAFKVDVFNVSDNQAVTSTDQNYTLNNTYPIVNGTVKDLAFLKTTAGVPVAKNVNFGNASSYQSPLTLRLGATLSF